MKIGNAVATIVGLSMLSLAMITVTLGRLWKAYSLQTHGREDEANWTAVYIFMAIMALLAGAWVLFGRALNQPQRLPQVHAKPPQAR